MASGVFHNEVGNVDIRVDVNFFQHPKTIRLERQCGLAGVKSLLLLWCWAAQNRPEGTLANISAEDVEIIAGWDGEKGALLAALTDLRWLDEEGGTYSLHDWNDWNAWVAASVTRGDKARLSRMARSYPELYAQLKAAGAEGITRAEYLRLTTSYDRSTIVNDSSTVVNERSTVVNHSSTIVEPSSTSALAPAPAPPPSPITCPVPVVEELQNKSALELYHLFPGYEAASIAMETTWIETLDRIAPSLDIRRELLMALKWVRKRGVKTTDTRGFITDWLRRKQSKTVRK